MFSRQTFKASGIRELAWVAMTALVVAGAPPSTQPKPMAQHGVTTNRAPVEAPEDCALCGMNRTRFSRSRMLANQELRRAQAVLENSRVRYLDLFFTDDNACLELDSSTHGLTGSGS